MADRPDLYYGGSWVDIYPAPLSRSVSTSLKKTMYSIGWTGRKITDQPDPLEIDLLKQPGVPGQGQTLAPLCFGNHYVVYAKGKLYDTSYGAAHPVDFDAYRDAAIGGWLVERRPDRYVAPWRQGRQLAVQQAWAWFCYETGKRKLQYELGARN